MRYLRLAPRPAATLDPRRAPLVLIHGLLGFSFSWRHNLEALAAKREVYAVDLLGMGYSDRPGRGIDYGLHATAARMLEWLKALGLSKVDLLGTSHGGATAMMMAALDRERRSDAIARLVLAAPANPWSRAGAGRIAFFGSGMGRWLAGLAVSRSSQVRRTVRLLALNRMYGDPKKVTAETLNGYSRMIDVPGTIEYALDVVRSWKEDMRELESRFPCAGQCARFAAVGQLDRAVAPESGHELAANMTNAKIDGMNGVGHMPYEESPEQFNRLTWIFLTTATARPESLTQRKSGWIGSRSIPGSSANNGRGPGAPGLRLLPFVKSLTKIRDYETFSR